MKYLPATLLLFCQSLSQAIELPRSVNLVLTKEIDQSLVRIIGHNMHITHEIEIQRLKIPGLALQEQKIIKQVTVNGRVFDFKQSTMTRYKVLRFEEHQVYIRLLFIPLRDPNDYQLDCKVDVSNNQIGEPQCTKTLYKWPEGT